MSQATKPNTYNNGNNNVAYTFYYVLGVVCAFFEGMGDDQNKNRAVITVSVAAMVAVEVIIMLTNTR